MNCQAPGPHTYNLSYSGGRDQEDHNLKPAQANSSQDPILKKPITYCSWAATQKNVRQDTVVTPVYQYSSQHYSQ
jgi:hypothetical protein